ncbi:MAG: hypothetical protein ACT4TC_02130 [Myxococcaceae bacterium]
MPAFHSTSFAVSRFIPPHRGECLPFRVSLVDVYGAPALAPYSVKLQLTSTVSGAFFADAACTQGVVPPIDPGSATRDVYFRADAPGPASFLAAHVDFLAGAPFSVQILAGDAVDSGVVDSGAVAQPPLNPGPLLLGVGCGCSTSVAAHWLVLFAWLPTGLRLRPARATSQPGGQR